MAASSLSLPVASSALPKRIYRTTAKPCSLAPQNIIVSSSKDNTSSDESRNCKRRPLLLGLGALSSLSLLPANPLLAEVPERFSSFVDKEDGYAYYYPSDWTDFDFRGHDSAFKDRHLQLQNVRVSFIPTEQADIHDLGPMQETVYRLVNHVYAAPSQIATIMDVQEKTIEGKNYCTFEYVLTSVNFSRAAFATIAVGNGRFYTLVVGANERRWRRIRNKLKVVADSFKLLDI
nr:photosynthetic NDH subunit of lumenal location 1, chloroplastic [Ipomoea batatas]